MAMLSPANMRAFAAVVEAGSFTLAAERLNATQSGVSQQVAKLERHLGVPLLVRGTQGAVPTPAGRQLYRRCVQILSDIAAAETELRGFDRGLAGSIRIGLMPAMTRCMSGPVLRRIMAEHPNMRIDAIERVGTDLIASTMGADIDLAIVPVFDAPDALRCRAIGATGEVLVYRGRRSRDHMRPVDLRRLPPLRLILQSAGHIRRERILARLKALGVEIATLMDLDSMFGTLEFVANSDFATILPAIMMVPEIESAELCVRPIRSRAFALDLIAIEPRRRGPSPIAALLIEAFAAALQAFNHDMAARSR